MLRYPFFRSLRADASGRVVPANPGRKEPAGLRHLEAIVLRHYHQRISAVPWSRTLAFAALLFLIGAQLAIAGAFCRSRAGDPTAAVSSGGSGGSGDPPSMRADCWDVESVEAWIDPNLSDSEPPVLGTPSPASGSQLSENFTLRMPAQDASPIVFQVFVDGMQLCQGTSLYDAESGGLRLDFPTAFYVDGEEYPVVLAQGSREIRLVAIDKAGNSAETTVTYAVNNSWAGPLLAQASALAQEIQADPSLTTAEKTAYLTVLNYYSVWFVNPGEHTVQDHIQAYLAMKAAYLQAGWEWGLDDNEFLNWWGQYAANRVLLPFLAARSEPGARNETDTIGKIFGWLKDVGKKLSSGFRGIVRIDPRHRNCRAQEVHAR